MASLEILLPNGQVLGAQVYIEDPILGPIPWDGVVSVGPAVGAATEAKQDVGNTSLASIDSKIPALGQAVAGSSVPIVLTAAQLLTLTPIAGLTDAQLRASAVPVSAATLPLPTDAATQTTLALVKAKTDNIPALGQALAAGSIPIVLTAIQLAAITPPAAITGFATSANQTTEIASLANLDVALSTRTKPSDQQHVIIDSGVTTGLTDTQLRATPVPISGTVTITDGAGALNVIVDSSALPTLAATSTKQDTQITAEQAIQAAVEIIDDVAYSANAAFSKSAAIGGQLDDTGTTVATENNVSPVRITAQRALHTNLRDVSGTEFASGTTNKDIDTSTAPYVRSIDSFPVSSGAGNLSASGNSVSMRMYGSTLAIIQIEVVAGATGTWVIQEEDSNGNRYSIPALEVWYSNSSTGATTVTGVTVSGTQSLADRATGTTIQKFVVALGGVAAAFSASGQTIGNKIYVKALTTPSATIAVTMTAMRIGGVVQTLPLPAGSNVIGGVTVDGLLIEQDIASADITGPLIQGKVEDAASNGINLNTVHPLSLTSDGRLRVATAAESYNYTPWGDPNSWGSDGSTIEDYPLSAW